MQKTDLELQEAIDTTIQLTSDVTSDYVVVPDVKWFIENLAAAGYKIVKDTD